MPASKMRRRMGRDPTHLRHSAALLWALMLGIAGAASGGAGSGSSTLPRDAECAGKGACCGSTPQDDTGSGGPRFSVVTVEVGEECQVFRVYMVTYTTDLANKGFCVMAASAAARAFRLNVLGEGRQENFEREMYLDKLWALAEFVDAVDRANAGPDRDRSTRSLILFVDAYDVLVTGSPSRLVKRMLETQKKIMYSSEAGCTASREALMHKLFNVPGCDLRWPAPANDTAMPWINSGVLAGFVPQVAALLEAAREERYSFVDRITREIGPIQEIHAMPPANPGPWDPYIVGGDQSLIGHLYSHHTFPPTHQHAGQLLREALHMGIDYNARLFLSAFGMHIGQEIKFSAKKRVVRVLACILPPPPPPYSPLSCASGSASDASRFSVRPLTRHACVLIRDLTGARRGAEAGATTPCFSRVAGGTSSATQRPPSPSLSTSTAEEPRRKSCMMWQGAWRGLVSRRQRCGLRPSCRRCRIGAARVRLRPCRVPSLRSP